MSEDLVHRLKKRAEIRRQITDRRSVQEGKPDRIADLLEEAARALETREWVGLTDDQKLSLEIQGSKADVMLAELVEQWLKEKNT